jgi:hypothetical protein
MKKLLFVSLSLGAILFSGCQKEEPVKCILPTTSISVNSPVVISAETISLTTPVYSWTNDVAYNWSGPNGFISNLQNPVITNVTPAMAGEYKLKITKGICETEEVKTIVNVFNNTTVTCTQANDTGTFDIYYPNTLYLNYNTAHGIANNEFEIVGHHSTGFDVNIYVNFMGSDNPITGIYSIVSKDTPLSPGQVHVRTLQNAVHNYYGKSGDVLVSYDLNGNIKVKFCNIPFSYSTGTVTSAVGSAMFIQNHQ